jgi:hypothetical protein
MTRRMTFTLGASSSETGKAGGRQLSVRLVSAAAVMPMSTTPTVQCEQCHRAIPGNTPREHVGCHYFHPACLIEYLLIIREDRSDAKPPRTTRWQLFRRRG